MRKKRKAAKKAALPPFILRVGGRGYEVRSRVMPGLVVGEVRNVGPEGWQALGQKGRHLTSLGFYGRRNLAAEAVWEERE